MATGGGSDALVRRATMKKKEPTREGRKWRINPAWVEVPYQETAFAELGKDGIWRQGIRRSRMVKGEMVTETVSSKPMLNPPQ